MAYIHTSRTRKRTPANRQLIIEHPDAGERRIVDPRQADKLLGNNHGWSDPKPAPGTHQEI